MKTKIQIIKNAVNHIKQMNFNGYQINSNNDAIINVGEAAISSQSDQLINIALMLIAKNINGFKSCSFDDPETIYSIQARECINNQI